LSDSQTKPPSTLGVFTVDTTVTIRAWDRWMEEATGIASADASGRPLIAVVPSIAERGLIKRFEQVLETGEVQVLAPAFHHYLIPCAPRVASPNFDRMQQRVTLGALREESAIVGVMVTVEDVTTRLDAEQALAAALRSSDAAVRESAARDLAAADAIESPDVLTDVLRGDDWNVRRAAVAGLAPHASRDLLASLLTALRLEHRDFNVLSSALQLLAMSEVDLTAQLGELLRDSDSDLRIQAALALGQQQHPAAIAPLVTALGDSEPNVRFHAIEALGRLRATEAIDPLADIAESGDFYLSFPAVDALARIGDPRVVSRLLKLLSSSDLSETVAEALGELGGGDVVQPLATMLNAGSAAGPIVRALARLFTRYEERYGGGAYITAEFQAAIAPTGAQTLLDAAADAGVEDLRSLVLVLSWLRGPAVERALTRMLGQPTIRTEVIEALVRQGAPVVPQLIEQLRTEDAETRLAAIVALGRLADRRATEALVGLLGRNRDLTVAAAGALAELGDPAAFEPLLRLLGDKDVAVRQAAIGALNSLGHPEMCRRVVVLLNDDNPHVRESAARIAGYFGYRESIDAMLARCSDPIEGVRRAALELLPLFDDSRAPSALVRALQTDTPRARAAAAQGLALLSGKAPVTALIEALRDSDPWVRYFSARSLASHRAIESLPALVGIAADDSAMHVRIAALEAIGAIDGTAAVDALLPYTEADQLELAGAALRGLGSASDDRAARALRSGLRAPDSIRRLAAIEGLAARTTDESVSLLSWTAGADEDDAVGQAAVDALARIARSGPQADAAVDALVQITAEPARRQWAVAALAGLPDARIPRIASALQRDPPVIRRALIGALGRMKHPDASSALRSALDDEDPLVRESAITALDRLGARGVSRTFALLARKDPSAVVRRAAASALSRQPDPPPSSES
jgi:HEAT repeat protein